MKQCDVKDCKNLATREVRRYAPFAKNMVQRFYICHSHPLSDLWQERELMKA